MTALATYAAIDADTGLLWGVTTAAGAVSAATAIDLSADASAAAGSRYEAVSQLNDDGGYLVYTVPANHAEEAAGWGADDFARVEQVCWDSAEPIRVTRRDDEEA